MEQEVEGKGSYCRHRYSLVKRWVEDGVWFAIEHCRWCDDYKRVQIRIDSDANKLVPQMKTHRITEERSITSNDL